MKQFWWIAGVAVLGLPAGCSESGTKLPALTEAEGVVLLGGQPLPNASVTFTPLTPGLPGTASGTGITDESGRFVLRTAGKFGVVIGEHTVTVMEGPTPDNLRDEDAQQKMVRFQAGLKNRPIPVKYGSLAKSDVKIDVSKDRKEYKIELSR